MPCSSEIFPYKSCIFYAVVTSLIALDRVALKKQVVDAPEVLSVIDQIPSLSSFLNSLYFCKYKEFFQVKPAPPLSSRQPQSPLAATPLAVVLLISPAVLPCLHRPLLE
jgi:hypothetical protein